MRRLLFALALSAGLLVVPSSANAQLDLLEFQSAVEAMQQVDPTLDPPPNDGKHDFAVGGFQRAFNDGVIGPITLNVGLSAHSDPLGNDAWGFEATTFPGDAGKIRARATCLAVDGNLAAIGVVVTHSNSNDLPPGTEFVNFVRDSGLPGGQGDGFGTIGRTRSEDCPLFVEFGLFAFPIHHGNILVHDAQP